MQEVCDGFDVFQKIYKIYHWFFFTFAQKKNYFKIRYLYYYHQVNVFKKRGGKQASSIDFCSTVFGSVAAVGRQGQIQPQTLTLGMNLQLWNLQLLMAHFFLYR